MGPAPAIIRNLGGEVKVAGIAGTALSAPYRWQHEKSRGGTGGMIPQAYHRRLLDYADAHGIALAAEEFLTPARERAFGSRMMRASFENMQRRAVVSQRAGGGFNRNARARRRNNQSEHRDALGAPRPRRLLRERGTPQDAVGKMKVSESIDIEFLQAKRLQDFFVFHCRCPIRQVMEVSGHNFRVPYSKLFLQVVAQ